MSTELEQLRNKADRLADVRRKMYAMESTFEEAIKPLRTEADILKQDLLNEFTLLDLKSFKAGDGTGYAVTPTKSIAFDPVAEASVLKWASEHNAVTLDKKKLKDLVKRGVALPDFIRVQTTNTIRITNPKT